MDELIFLHSPFLLCVCVGGGGIKAVTTVVPLQKVKIYCQIVSSNCVQISFNTKFDQS